MHAACRMEHLINKQICAQQKYPVESGSVVVAAAVAMVVEVVVVVDPLVKLTSPFAQQAIALGNTKRQQQ